MKHMKLAVFSCLALVFARPAGFCTANTVAENEAQIADLKALLEKQQEEIKNLRAGLSVPPLVEVTLTSTDLLIKGAGVDPADVNWRIRAGLTPEQAVQVAMAEKLEREAAVKLEGAN